jgi:hypothetical protein
MLFLVLSGALCYAHGETKTENRKDCKIIATFGNCKQLETIITNPTSKT